MYKKIVGILIIGFFISFSILSGIGKEIELKQDERVTDLSDATSTTILDDLDQHQEKCSDWHWVNSRYIAQSFKPTRKTLTRVQINIVQDTQGLMKVSIRKSLTGNDLTSITKIIDQTYEGGRWEDFDFPNINVIPNDTYFIVTYSYDVAPGIAGAAIGEANEGMGSPDYYTRGEQWILRDNEWRNWNEWYIDMTFRTYGYDSGGNNIPNAPSNPNPSHHATTIDINTNLSWTGGDQDLEDTVTYDIYFGTTYYNPPLKKSNHGTTTYDPGTMNTNTKYYWKIVAKDNHGATATGPIWDFTTGSSENQPPNVEILYPEEYDIVTGLVSIYGIASDPDGNGTLNRVEVRIDDKLWQNSTGKEFWEYSWNTDNETEGLHTIRTRSFDGELYSNDFIVNVTLQHGLNNIIISNIKGSFGIKADIKNIGTEPTYNVDWSIDVEPGFGLVLSGSNTIDMIDELVPGEPVTVQSKDLRGIGFITITVQAADVVKTATAFLLGPLVLRVVDV